jgi:predicted small lipoprotein YifL
MRNAAGLLVLSLLLSACGTKGPLYLPTPEQQAQAKAKQEQNIKQQAPPQ